MRKAAEQAELIISDSDSDSDDEVGAAQKSRKAAADKARAAAKKAELAAMLATPLSAASRVFGGKYPTKTGKLELPADLTGKSLTFAVL